MLLNHKGLRLQQLEDLDERDEHFLWLMHEYPPDTQLKHGDICYLLTLPPRIRWNPYFEEHGVPRFWKVQFVVSAYQFELHTAMQCYGFGGDQAITYLDSAGFDYQQARNPVVYAHGFPHGDNPNTAEWFPERILRRLCLRTEDVDWEPVLDEFQTPFHGYDPTVRGGFVLDMAPDLYADGTGLGGPLSHEEPTFHSASTVGLERAMMVRDDPRHFRSEYEDIDPEHDVFVHPWDSRLALKLEDV